MMSMEHQLKLHQGWMFSPGHRFCDEDVNYVQDKVEWHHIEVPYCWNGSKWMTVVGEELYTNGYYKDLQQPPFKDHQGVGWYKKSFNVPKEWENKRIHIHFDGVSAKAILWINGREVGEHFGAYSEFDWDITDYLVGSGEQTMVIKVWDKSCFYPSDDKAYENHKINTRVIGRRTMTPVGETKNNGGIDRPVTLYATEGAYVQHIDIETTEHDFVAKVTLKREEIFGKAYKVTARICHKETGKVIYEAVKETGLPEQETTLLFRDCIEEAKLWWPHDPQLYTLIVELECDGKDYGKCSKVMGFKTMIIEDSKFYLNGSPYFLRAAGTPPHPIIIHDRAYIKKFLDYCKELNLNCIRFHTEPPSQEWLDGCDEHGLLAIYEMPLMQQCPEPVQTRKEFRDMVKAVKHHPSLAYYCICNENDHFAQISEAVGYKELHIYLNDLHEAIKEADPTLPVCNNSGYKDIRTSGDIKDVHSYNGWYNASMIAFEKAFIEGEDPDGSPSNLYFGKWHKRVEEENHKPLILTEFIAAYTDDNGRFFQVPCSRRFIGKDADPDNKRALWYQAHHIAETVEIFRRERNDYTNLAGVSPFALFNWFFNPLDINKLAPKPAALVLKSIMEPTHASIRCRHRRKFVGHEFTGDVYLIHDDVTLGDIENASLTFELFSQEQAVYKETIEELDCQYYSNKIIPFNIEVPPINEERKDLKLVVTWRDDDGKCLSCQSITLVAFNKQDNKSDGEVKIFDPQGKTAYLDYLEKASFVKNLEDITPADKLIIGCNAYTSITQQELKTLEKLVQQGLSVLILEQNLFELGIEDIHIDWIKDTPLMIVKEGRGIDDFVDVRNDQHEIFTGLEKEDFREWNGDTILISSYVQQGEDSRKIPAATRFGSRFGNKVRKYDHVKSYIECANFSKNDGLIEVAMEKGKVLWNQVEASRRFNSDAVATTYLQNLIQYFIES